MKKSHGLVLSLVGALSLFVAEAAETVWEVHPNTMDDADVRTEGRCLYAYTPSAARCRVNGVEFARFSTGASSIADDVVFADVRLYSYDGFVPDSLAWTGSAGYRALLKNAWYYSNSYQARTYSIQLNGLEAGKRHLVQFWVCDARGGRGGERASVGDVSGSKEDAGGVGVNFTGTFTAESAQETIAVTFSSEMVFNAIQVRCLDDAQISWTACATAGAGDVRTEGDAVYAYKAGADHAVNGVLFRGASPQASAWGDDIEFSSEVGLAYEDFCWSSDAVPSGACSYSEDYRLLVGCGFYRSFNPCLRRNITLKNLEPGARYLVQIWNFDNRSGSYAGRTVLYDNAVTVSNSADAVSYGHGSHVVGVFTATSDRQTIGCYARDAASMVACEEMLGPIQVRCLDRDAGGFVSGNTAADGSVVSRGVPLYAYSARATTVSGVGFRAFASRGDQYGDIEFAANGEVRTRIDKAATAFLECASVPVSPAVSNLLAGALYRDDGVAENEVRLRRLVAGRRYLVQAWFTDARSNGLSKFVNFGGAIACYQVESTAPLGQYVAGVFRATNSTHAIAMNKANMQINAIQVRALDAGVAASSRWTVSDTLEGEASVATEGTLLYAYAPAACELDNGVVFAAADAKTEDWGGMTLSQSFRFTHDAFGDNGQTGAISRLLNHGWYLFQGSSADLEITLRRLTFGHEYLVQLFVADLRGTTSGGRTISVCGESGRYGSYGDDAAPYGTVCTGRFRADADSFSFQVNYDTAAASQLNAIQVRDLGPSDYVRDLADASAWTADGGGWLLDGESQAGSILWGVGSERIAAVEGDAKVELGADVCAGIVAATGSLELGAPGTDRMLTVASEVVAPTATVNAVWGSRYADKTTAGTTVLAGAMPNLAFVNVAKGRLVLAGAADRPVNISVAAPGELGFGGWRELAIASLSGDGTLVGPGGIVFADGKEHAVPTSLANGEGFAWRLANGASIALADGADARRIRVRIDDPREYGGRVAVRAAGSVVGKPEFVLPSSAWRAAWDAELSGWRICNPSLIVIR